MGLFLKFGVYAYSGGDLLGVLNGIRVQKGTFDVEALLISFEAASVRSVDFSSVERCDQDRMELLPMAGLIDVPESDPGIDTVLLDYDTRVSATDGWVASLVGVEADQDASSVTHFVFDMGHSLSRLVSIERYFVKDIRAGEISFKLGTSEIKRYPAYPTRL